MVKLCTRILIICLAMYATSVYSQAEDPVKPEETIQGTLPEQTGTVDETPVPETPVEEIAKEVPAQAGKESAETPRGPKKILLGVNLGYGGLMVKAAASKDKPNWLNSLHALLLAEYMLNDSFSLSSELGYSHGLLTNIQVVSSSVAGGSFYEQDSLSAFEGNFTLRYNLPLFGWLTLFAGLGADFGLMTYYIEVPQIGNIVSNGVENVTITSPSGSFKGTGLFLGASANLGARFKIEEDLDLIFTSRFNYNFISKLSWETSNTTTDLTHMAVSFSLGPVMRF